jgi:hypothetical protein
MESLAHPQFLKKEPLDHKPPRTRKGALMGFREEEFGSSS